MFRDNQNKKLLTIQLIIVFISIILVKVLSLPTKTLLLLTASLLISYIVTWIYLYKQSNRIKNLSKYMNNILNNNYSLDIREYEEGDLSNLKNDIYKMTVKLKEQSDLSQKDKKYLEEILSDISHQLKTPLTSMYVINDVLISDKKITPEKKQEFLIKNRRELERIEWLVTTLLKMSRLDSGSEQIKTTSISLKTLFKRVLEPLEIPIELKNQNLVLEYDPEIIVNIDLNWTTEAFINILKNAHEHTKENGTIIIRSNDTPIYTEIEIIDNGEGIDPKDLPHIFERFYKGKSNKESIGIGLNMAKKVINLEKGDIKATSTKEGTTFNIKFYKQNI